MNEHAVKGRQFALFQGLLPINPSQLPTEVIAGLTLAALAIPEVLGYTKISGTPVITGLYTIQSAATSRAFASRYNERFSENTDLVGLGMANVGAGLSGTFMVSGSPTKTQMVDGAGGRSQVAHLTTVAVVLLVLLLLTGPLAYMPEAVLAAVVFLIGLELIKFEEMRKIFVEARSEFWVALLTAATVVVVGVEQGIILAMVLSLLDHVRRGYRPKNSVVAPADSGGWHMVPVSSPVQFEPGLMVYRFSHSMYYANAEQFSEQMLELTGDADPPLSWLCIDAVAVDDVDYSAAETLRSIHGLLKDKGIRLVFGLVGDEVLSFVGVRLLQLREVMAECVDPALAERPCTEVLSDDEWRVLWVHRNRKRPPKQAPPMRWAYTEIAKLGGWLDTKRTGRVGWDTFWYGWFRLQERVDTYVATRDHLR